jgi:hypothetical protein
MPIVIWYHVSEKGNYNERFSTGQKLENRNKYVSTENS